MTTRWAPKTIVINRVITLQGYIPNYPFISPFIGVVTPFRWISPAPGKSIYFRPFEPCMRFSHHDGPHLA